MISIIAQSKPSMMIFIKADSITAHAYIPNILDSVSSEYFSKLTSSDTLTIPAYMNYGVKLKKACKYIKHVSYYDSITGNLVTTTTVSSGNAGTIIEATSGWKTVIAIID